MILTRPAYHAAMPPISPPPPTATSSVSMSGSVLLDLEAERALAEQRLRLVEGVDWRARRFPHESLARRERVGVALAADDELGAVAADALGLGRRRDGGHENRRRRAEPHRRIGDRRAVIAARGRDDAGLRDRTSQQVGEGAARLERARMLQELELEVRRARRQAEIGHVGAQTGVRRICGRMTRSISAMRSGVMEVSADMAARGSRLED